jgi:hypothetical protein
VILTSHAPAGQGVKNEPEPSSGSAILGSGAVISRRFFVNKLVSLPVIAAAIPTAAPALPVNLPQADTVAADRELMALVEEYIVAQRRWNDLSHIADEMSTDLGDPREVLRIRPRDLELGRKPTFDSADEFWHRPCDIDQWRQVDEVKSKWREKGDRSILVMWKEKAPEELRLRGAEIVTAYDQWRSSARPRRGYKKALRESKRAERNVFRLENEIAETPADTIEGMRAKIRCAGLWGHGEKVDSITGGCEEAMAVSIFADIQRIAARALS